MIGNDKSANRFLERIKGNLDDDRDAAPAQEASPSRVVINRAVRCTIIVGQVPEHSRPQARRAQRKG